MITKGILKTIDYNENSCTVRLPLFESAAASGEVVLPAIFINQPGSFNGYNEGDVVFVDFENNSLTSPVVIGKLYLGAAKELANPKKGGFAVADLTVTSTASLPLDTKLVLDKSALSTVSVDNGLDTYKSILDIIKALHKTTTSMDRVTEDSLESITNIKVEYLSQAVGLVAPSVEDTNWSSSMPAYKEGYEIWQKTTCYNRRNQILGEPEIICLSSATSTASYWLKCSTRIHSGTNQATNIKIKAIVKLGSNLETLDAEVILKYKWASESDGNWHEIENVGSITITPEDCKDDDLLVEAWRPGATEAYESETITFAPKNTPVLDLDNDNASIAYDSRGTNKLNWNDSVSSSAAVYFNGEQVTIPAENFTWTLTNCKVKGSNNTTFKTNTIAIYEIVEADTATAECVVNYNGVELKKTFTITKVRQGTSSYKLDITNDFVSVITGSNGVISWNEASWEANTSHTINIYYGYELETKKIRIVNSETELSANSGLCLVYTTNNVTLKDIDEDDSSITTGTATLSLTSLSDYSDTGDIKYQLFNNLSLLASAKFEINRIRYGEAATSYWLKLSANSHLGTEQPASKPLNIVAMTKKGIETEAEDLEAILWWRLPNVASSKWTKAPAERIISTDPDDNEIKGYKYSSLAFDAAYITNIIKNNSIEIIATHNSEFIPDETTDFLDTTIYEEEIIEYAPRNTPILTLTNDSDALSYNYLGQCLDLDSATTTAQVVFNGDNVTGAAYGWTFTSIDNNGNKTSITNLDTADTKITKTHNTIVVHKIPSSKLEATCTATYTWDGQSSTMTKVFTVVRQLQGEASVSHWLKFDSFVHTGAAHKSTITVTAMKKIGADGAEENDDTATLYWRYKNGNGSWEEALDNPYILKLTPTFKADDIEIIATHDKTLVVDKDTTSDTEGIYEFETITYSPLNTPVIDLTNDSASLNYSADGKTKIGEACVESTASLWLNGEPLYASFEWDVSRFKQGKAGQKQSETGPEFDTIYVYEISDDPDIYSAEATVTATVLEEGPFKGKQYTKKFRVTKSLKGADGATAVMYKAHVSSETIAWSKTSYTPSSIDVYLEKIEGNNITKVPTYISYSVNGGSFQKDVSITNTPYIKSSWGMAAVTSSLVLKFYLSSDDRKNDTNMVDQITITAVHDGQDGDSSEIQYAFLWSDDYLYVINKNLPSVELENKSASKETWFIRSLTDAPEIKETRKIIFISSRSGIGSDITNIPWSKPEVFAVASEKAYQILKTSEGLFGYGQGVYYTVDTTATFDNKTFTAGEKYTPEDLAAYAAESETNRNNIKVYINAEYIKTGAFTVGDTKEPLFQAGLDNKVVTIGGWNVDNHKLYAGTDSRHVALRTSDEIIKNNVKYEVLSYIQNNGADNYIDSGITLNFDTGFTVEVDYAPTVENQRYCLLSSYVGSGIDCLALEVYTDDKTRFFNVHDVSLFSSNKVKINEQNKSIFKYSNGEVTINLNGVEFKDGAKVDISKTKGDTGTTANGNKSLRIFADYRNKTFGTFNNPLRLYALKIYSGNNLVADFLPVKRKSDSAVGLYNLVTDSFKQIKGSSNYEYNTEFKAIYLGNSEADLAPFSVTNTGKLKAASGEIGGFKLTDSEFKITSLDTHGYTQADFLITNTDQEGKLDGGTQYYKAGGRTGTDWRLIVGQLFGVNNEGKLFAQDATIEGTLIGKQGTLENMTSITAEDIYCNSNLNCNNISLGGSGATITTNTISGSTSEETISLKLSADQPAPSYIGGNWLFSVKFETTGGEKVAKRCNTGYKLAWATFSCSVDKASGSGDIPDKIFNKVYFSNAAIILSADHTFVTNTTSAGGGGAPYSASWTLEEVCVVNSNNNTVSLENLSVAKAEIYKDTVTTNINFNCGVEAPTMIAEAFYATSDKRLKENIKEYVPQKSILDLPVVEFDFKESGAHQIGCIAQDLQEICPELVTTNVEGYLTISENKLVYLLLEEVKKLNSKVIELEQALKSERTK